MKSTRVVSMRDKDVRRYVEHGHSGVVRIDRKTRWGNPFKDGSREENIERYRSHLKTQIRSGEITVDDLKALHGKALACWCNPLPCHGDVLKRAVEWAMTK